jgi:hypothetical protein
MTRSGYLGTLAFLAVSLCCCADPSSPAGESVDAADDADTATSDAPPITTSDAAEEQGDSESSVSPVEAIVGAQVVMHLDGSFDAAARFFDHPWPSDLRLNPEGGPSMEGLPHPDGVDLMDGVLQMVGQRPGFPAIPVAWFRFDSPIRVSPGLEPTLALSTSPVQLIDVDPDSPQRGTRYPTMVRTLEPDPYIPDNVLSVAPWPGVVLPAGRRYGLIVRRDYGDSDASPLGVPLALRQLAAGERPAGDHGEAAEALFDDLWETLDMLGESRETIAAATVFTVGDVVEELYEMSEAVRSDHVATIDALTVLPEDAGAYPRFCPLSASLTVPAFQRGAPPFNTEGLFELDGAGQLVRQGEVSIPLIVTLPKGPMPEGGYPLVLYFHGSGGVSTQLIDRGTVTEIGGQPTPGEGPAHILAAHGFGAASSALPVNPERVDGATAFEYLNFSNLAAFRDTFRQGVIEQRLLLDALLALRVAPETVAACSGMSLPEGAESFHFASTSVFGMGQSMGGMYTNMVGAVEPRLTALVPTGAGGFWSWFIVETQLLDAVPLLKLVLGTEGELSFMHPALHLLQTAWEAAEPMVFMPRLSARPLPGHPARDVYEPVGLDDSYFPFQLFDAVALAYGHQQAGDIVWPSLQDSLALGDKDGVVDYPVSRNLTSDSGALYTGVVVQYLGDGIYDPHAIFAQLDAVKYQYGCFFETAHTHGAAVVPAPAPLGTPCPTASP